MVLDMKPKKPQGDPGKTLLIILIGAIMMIVMDLFVLGGMDQIRPKGKTLSPQEISAIQAMHHQYMQTGADIEISSAAETLAQKDFAEPDKPFISPDLISPYTISVPAESALTESSSAASSAEDFVFGAEEMYPHSAAAELPPFEEPLMMAPLPSPSPDSGLKNGAEQENAQKKEKPAVSKENLKSPYTYKEPEGEGLVVIMIDDMGLSAHSREVENLPGPLTLSYLPYAERLPEKAAYAKSKGHELMVHMPMEPLNGKLDAGPAVLRVGQDPDAFGEILNYDLTQFSGYAGVNNHMGSRLTQDADAMRLVMKELKKRGVYFVDSKTIGNSVAADIAAESGLPYAERDVFLDHEMTPEFVAGALANLEKVAYRKGYAIAIGHPHEVTIAALKRWLPTLKEKGLTLVPASAVVKRAEEPLLAVNANVKPDAPMVAGGRDEGLVWESREAVSSDADNGDE